jgi:hypothetical protein
MREIYCQLNPVNSILSARSCQVTHITRDQGGQFPIGMVRARFNSHEQGLLVHGRNQSGPRQNTDRHRPEEEQNVRYIHNGKAHLVLADGLEYH